MAATLFIPMPTAPIAGCSASSRTRWWLFALACLLLPFCLRAAPPVLTRDSEEAALRRLTGQADVIFAGELLSVSRAADGPPSLMEVRRLRFRVDTPIRGVSSGLLTAVFPEDFPAQPGQRFILFLRAPNAAGRTSTVGGSCGRLSLAGGQVDLRRLGLCFPVKPEFSRAAIDGREAAEPSLQSVAAGDLLRLLQQLAREPPTGVDHVP